MILQELLTEAFRVVHVFVVDDNEEIVFAPNIINHSETYHVQCEYGTDAESESDDGLVDPTSDGEYDFDELELIKMQKNKEVNANLSHYKDLFLNMTFKNLDDARKTCPGYKLKTFKQEHNCEEALHNPRATTNTLSHYFKSKVQNNLKCALKDMKQDLMDNFNLNTNDSKLKRAKRMALQKMQGSFLDEYNRLEAYANEIRMTNPGSDVVINLSKDAMWIRRPLPTWTWFLPLLEKSLDLKNGDSITFMSDIQKEAAKDLVKFPPQKWCKIYFDTKCKNQMVDNNFTESFNSWILVPRGKPILKMLEEIRVKIMNSKIANLCKLEFNGDLGFEVSEGEDRHIVNIVEKKCSCRSWQLTGIPCPHVIKALRYKNIEPRDEISWWYTKEAYLKTYGAKLLPMRGEQFWQVLPEHAMDPPDLVKTVGRPKFKRDREKNAAIKRAGEWSHSRKGTKMTCSKCGSQAHNARSCLASEEGNISSLKRKRGRTEEVEQDEEVFYVNSSAPQLTQEGFESDISAPRQRQYEPFGPTRELKSDPVLRPRIIFEELTRLKMRQNQQTRSANRVITFRGDHRGVSEPTDLPYSPTKVTWKGKEAMTSNQLERAREKKVGKLKTKIANGRSQI
ncbi:hypothetical protein MTR67_048703 [Solanum verrucosum]|uniref:SWIM-type domain-containing protein n=1 Tax=Solanum verrucosum TaxID=315347 RepID=A0AAF0V209_SOLVR|nr:hypothetical protein MTR67_048703 [Solanum verrucosum]